MISPVSTTGTLRLGEVTTASGLAEASDLYRDVFGYTKPEATLNPRLLMAMIANGGSAVGAWDADDRLVAFGYGFAGFAGGDHYFYSQAVVVASGLQGSGVGRLIKYEQRRIALDKDLHRMRWAYNPILTRNAHFNLSVLGAVGRWFAPDCYGDGESRLVVEWDLDNAAGQRPTPWTAYPVSAWGQPDRRGEVVAVPLPSDRGEVTPALIETIDAAFAPLFGEGLVALNCLRQDERTAVYLFGNADA